MAVRVVAALWVFSSLAAGQSSAAAAVVSPTPTAAMARSMLRKLDAAFNAGDVASFFGAFEPSSRLPMLQLRQKLGTLLAKKGRLTRSSRLLRFETHSSKGIALVETRTRSKTPRTDLPENKTTNYLVFDVRPDGPRGLFWVDVTDAAQGHINARGVYSCPPCNFKVGAASGWLPVAHHPNGTGCAEVVNFYSLLDDSMLEVSVMPALPEVRPTQNPVAYLRQLRLGPLRTPLARVQSWLVPNAGLKAPAGLKGARGELLAVSGSRTYCHVITYGAMRYLLALHVGPKADRRELDRGEALVRTFHIANPELSPMVVAEHATLFHTGEGRLDGTRYVNHNYRVSFVGPAGWSARPRAGDWLFQVEYQCPPSRGSLRVTGYAPLPSFNKWFKLAADTVLESLTRRAKLEIDSDGDWKSAPQSQWKEIVARPRARSSQIKQVIARMVMFDDMLLVMVGEIRDRTLSADEVRRAFATLERLR